MPRTQMIILLLLTGLGTFVVPSATAQVTIAGQVVNVELTGRVHTQFNTTSVAGADNSQFLVRRARVSADVSVNDFVSGRVQPDYGGGSLSLKDAYVRLTFSRQLRITMGQFKRPFDLFELTSSTQILVIERAGGIRGVDSCAGPGGVCSYSRLTESLELSDRDVGVMADGRSASGRVQYAFSITNGTGANSIDENGSKSFSGRVAIVAVEGVTVGGNAAVHDFANPVTGNDDHAVAIGGDLELGNFSQGLHAQAGATFGRNWQNLDATGNPADFATVQAILTYKALVEGDDRITGVEPVGRISWADPDTDMSNNGGFVFTPGLVVHFIGRNKIAANIDIWAPASGPLEWSLKMQSYLHF